LDILFKSGHIDIEEIYKNVREIIPSISIATIYKNLKILVEAGIVKEVNINSFKTLYEVNTKPHIHSICKECKKIIDINLTNDEIRDFLQKIVQKEIESFEINIFTKCDECKK